MKIRAGCLLLVFASLALPAYAQKPGTGDRSLAAQVAALSARVDKLEGNITAADLVGIYTVTSFETNLQGDFPAEVAANTFTGTVTLAADGSVSGTLTGSGYTLKQGNPWFVQSTNDLNGGQPGTFTWSYASGTLTLSTNGGAASFVVATGGRLLIMSSALPNFKGGFAQLVILTRLQ